MDFVPIALKLHEAENSWGSVWTEGKITATRVAAAFPTYLRTRLEAIQCIFWKQFHPFVEAFSKCIADSDVWNMLSYIIFLIHCHK